MFILVLILQCIKTIANNSKKKQQHSSVDFVSFDKRRTYIHETNRKQMDVWKRKIKSQLYFPPKCVKKVRSVLQVGARLHWARNGQFSWNVASAASRSKEHRFTPALGLQQCCGSKIGGRLRSLLLTTKLLRNLDQYRLRRARYRPGTTRGAFRGRAPANDCLCPPNENCAPYKRGLCPEEINRLGAPECKSRPKTPKLVFTARIFVIFVDSHRISLTFATKTFFFWSSLKNSWKIASISRR